MNTELAKLLDELDNNNTDPNYLTNILVSIYQSLSDMTYEKLTRKEKKFYYKPWITFGIKKKVLKQGITH